MPHGPSSLAPNLGRTALKQPNGRHKHSRSSPAVTATQPEPFSPTNFHHQARSHYSTGESVTTPAFSALALVTRPQPKANARSHSLTTQGRQHKCPRPSPETSPRATHHSPSPTSRTRNISPSAGTALACVPRAQTSRPLCASAQASKHTHASPVLCPDLSATAQVLTLAIRAQADKFSRVTGPEWRSDGD